MSVDKHAVGNRSKVVFTLSIIITIGIHPFVGFCLEVGKSLMHFVSLCGAAYKTISLEHNAYNILILSGNIKCFDQLVVGGGFAFGFAHQSEKFISGILAIIESTFEIDKKHRVFVDRYIVFAPGAKRNRTHGKHHYRHNCHYDGCQKHCH